MNNEKDKKDEFASFYIRQMLGLVIIGIGCAIAASILIFIPFLGWLLMMVIYIGFIVLWIMSLIGAVNGEKKELPILGGQFQEWFKSL
jgi:uncharacterized membrane protein